MPSLGDTCRSPSQSLVAIREARAGGMNMDLGRWDDWRAVVKHGLTRRRALGQFASGGAAALLAAVSFDRRVATAEQATPTATTVTWQAMHFEVDFVPQHPVSITAAGGGPPQRGDWF